VLDHGRMKENAGMGTVAGKLTLFEFQSRYERSEQSYEYWHGDAIPKAMPTWIHGLLQRIILELLTEAGYIAASEVELRIVPDAHPKPDVIGTKSGIKGPYPTKALDVVVEILSEGDPMPYVLEKCQAYDTWGFAYIYVVNSESRQLFRWTNAGLELTSEFTSIPAARIWERLGQALQEKRK
jgi:Uma2 family endonuclease